MARAMKKDEVQGVLDFSLSLMERSTDVPGCILMGRKEAYKVFSSSWPWYLRPFRKLYLWYLWR